MDELVLKITDCSYDRLLRIAERCGFKIKEGRKHCKVKTQDEIFITTIPRHNRLKRETVRGIAEAFIKFGAVIKIQ